MQLVIFTCRTLAMDHISSLWHRHAHHLIGDPVGFGFGRVVDGADAESGVDASASQYGTQVWRRVQWRLWFGAGRKLCMGVHDYLWNFS
jgi:hypothetical protein